MGAGPGDPGLLTVKGLRALERAEVVVYDRLVSPAVLALIPPGARRIDVGKEASRHPVPQHRINQILLEEAQAGQTDLAGVRLLLAEDNEINQEIAQYILEEKVWKSPLLKMGRKQWSCFWNQNRIRIRLFLWM